MIWFLPAKIFGWVLWLYLTFELSVIRFFAKLPFASINLKWNWLLAVIYYLIILFFLYKFYRKQRKVILAEQYADKSS